MRFRHSFTHFLDPYQLLTVEPTIVAPYHQRQISQPHITVYALILVALIVLVLLSGCGAAEGALGENGAGRGNQSVESVTHIITPHDTVPRACLQPSVIALKSGPWSEPTIWSTGQLPSAEAKVQIPPGVTVRYDVMSTVGLDCIEVAGALAFQDQDTQLYVTDLQVLSTGSLTIGTAGQPISPQHTAEIVLRSTPLHTGTVENPGRDPSQYLTSMLVWGRVTIHGAPMARTFIRLAQEPLAGDITLSLEHPPTGWQVGDHIIIPDTRHIDPETETYKPQWEEHTIQSITGQTVMLTAPLQFDHPGARDADAARTPTVLPDGTRLLPHVGNLSRNVVIRSENPGGTRGHTYFAAHAAADVRYALWQDLGRTRAEPIDNTTFDDQGNVTHIGTNQIARYPLHHHHLIGPRNPNNVGYQFIALGNAIVGSGKWGLTIHNSHYGLIQDNVVYDIVGAGIVTETGNEYGNVFRRNFVTGIRGGFNEDGTFNGLGENLTDFGELGDAFWFAGPLNIVIDNVAASAMRTGYVVFTRNIPIGANVHDRPLPLPNFRGANMLSPDETTTVNISKTSLLAWMSNEVYGATTAGVTLWDVGKRLEFPDADLTILKNQRVWHIPGIGIRFYYNQEYELDGWVQRNDLTVVKDHEFATGGGKADASLVTHGGATAHRVYLRHFDGQGGQYGLVNRGRGAAEWLVIESSVTHHSVLKNYIDIAIRPWVQRPANGLRTTLIRNVVFDTLTDPALVDGMSIEPQFIDMQWRPPKRDRVFQHERILIEHYQNTPGQNYQVFYEEQAPHFIIPNLKRSGTYQFPQCIGLTNQACWSRHGGAIADEVAPCVEHDDPDCSQARALGQQLRIKGLVFRLDTPVPQPPRPAPILKMVIPFDGLLINGSTVVVRYYSGGDHTEIERLHLQLDDRPEVHDTDFDGTYVFSGVEPGTHTLRAYLARFDHSQISGTEVTVRFVTR